MKLEAFLSLEDSLAGKMKKSWAKMVEPLAKRVAAAIVKEDYDKAYKEIAKLKMDRVYKGNLRYVEYITNTALIYGASNMTPDIEAIGFVKAGKTPDIKKAAINQYKEMLKSMKTPLLKDMAPLMEEMEVLVGAIKEQGGLKKEEIKKAIPLDIIAKYIAAEMIIDGMTPEDLLPLISLAIAARMARTGESMIDIASSLHNSRMASYGFLTEATLMGVTKYEVNERLDNRTCQVCKTMHGKVFEVNTALTKLDLILRIDDPADIKTAAPWPKNDKASLDELRNMSDDELVSRGFNTPPYHPLCRGVLNYVGTTTTSSSEAREISRR